MRFAPLVENEILKLLKRRRFRVALLILIALIEGRTPDTAGARFGR